MWTEQLIVIRNLASASIFCVAIYFPFFGERWCAYRYFPLFSDVFCFCFVRLSWIIIMICVVPQIHRVFWSMSHAHTLVHTLSPVAALNTKNSEWFFDFRCTVSHDDNSHSRRKYVSMVPKMLNICGTWWSNSVGKSGALASSIGFGSRSHTRAHCSFAFLIAIQFDIWNDNDNRWTAICLWINSSVLLLLLLFQFHSATRFRLPGGSAARLLRFVLLYVM